MITKVVAGVVAVSKVAHAKGEPQGCRDEKQWSVCLDAYRNGECHTISGCDRTCGTCFGNEDCYDRIPEIHSFLFGTGGSVNSIWPNWNNNGHNNYPQIDTHGSNDIPNYPWEQASISTFCLDVFKNGLCEETENLEIFYQDYGKIQLHGAAKEYCQFTCGNCPEKGEFGQCWKDHNSKMVYLHGFGGQQETATDGFEDFADLSNFFASSESTQEEASEESTTDYSWGWGTEEVEADSGTESVESSWGWEPAEETNDYQWGESTSVESSWDWGASSDDSWASSWDWRKRRSAQDVSALSRGVLLTEAIESLIFPEVKDALPLTDISSRKRRSWAMNPMVGQTAGNFEEVEEQKRQLADLKCFTIDRLRNDDTGAQEGEVEDEEDEEYEGEEGEEGEDPLDRVRMQRHETDHKGINNWLADNGVKGVQLADDCEGVWMPYVEAYSEMPLAYTCFIKCPDGKASFIDKQDGSFEALDEEGIQMECSKQNYRKFNEDAVCKASQYCVGISCFPLVCMEVEEVEAAESVSRDYQSEEGEQWGNDFTGWGNDFLLEEANEEKEEAEEDPWGSDFLIGKK